MKVHTFMKNNILVINKNKTINSGKLGYIFIGGLLAVTGISGAVLRSAVVSADADSVTDTVAITVPVSCTMSGNIDTAHTATINNGIYSGASGSEYENGIGKTTLTTFCNDQNGFSIYAIGFTGDEAGNTNLAGTSASGNANIATSLYTSGNTSSWSMKVNKVDNPGGGQADITYNPQNMTIQSDTEGSFSSYHTVPDTYTKVAEYHASTGSSSTDIGTNALGSKITTTYAAYISPTQPADTYTGQVKYVMVHPYDAAAPTDSLCASNQLVMQNVSEWESDVTSGNEVTACDARDGKTYTVARLLDGNLWMTQNLDHDIVTDGSVTYDNTTTDLGYNTSTGTYDTASWTPARATYSSSTHTWGQGVTSTPCSWDASETCYRQYTPESYDPGDTYWNGNESDFSDWDAYYNTCTWHDDTFSYTDCNESLNPINTYTSSTGNFHYHLGNYYNWNAAVAMNDTSSYTTDGTLIEQSICPAGWTLPRVGTGNDSFYSLWNQYGFASSSYDDADSSGTHDTGEDALWTAPLYFTASGYYAAILGDAGYYGGFWSPVVYGVNNARDAVFLVDGDVGPSGSDYRTYGNSVRCIARPVASSVSGL